MKKLARYNKATVPMLVDAFLMLVNGRLPDDLRLSGDELGWALILLTALVAYLVPNAASGNSPKTDPPPDDLQNPSNFGIGG
ncbi:MAG: hypothetical protein AAF530_24210 [Pseudomonadota bacterium]